jgi:hypothetical protein
MKQIITSELTILQIDKFIGNELSSCGYWVDLNLSIEEYEILVSKLRRFILNLLFPCRIRQE